MQSNFKEIEMSDHEFAAWLRKRGWVGDSEPYGSEYVRFTAGRSLYKRVLAVVKYKNNSPVGRQIYINPEYS